MENFKNIYKEHIEDFKKSGINDETIKNLVEGGYLSSHDFYSKLYYPEPLENEKSSYYTTRQDCPYEDENGNEVGRYVRPKNESSRIYRPPALKPEILLNPDVELIITDGEKKAIKAVQEGYNCIAIAGVNGFLDACNDEDRLIPDMYKISLKDRATFIAFHGDTYEKKHKQRAFIKLASILMNQFGACVRMIHLPDSRKIGRALGLDDYLTEYGSDALYKLPITHITQRNVRTLFLEEDKINFPVEIFPDKIRDYVTTGSRVLNAPVEYIACALIAGVAILVNVKVHIFAKKDWREPCILWTVLVGEPGQAKSPALNEIKQHIDELDRKNEEKYEEAKRNYPEKVRAYKEKLREWEENDKEGDPPEEPTKPQRDLIYTSDTTKEAIIEMQKGSKNCVAIANDEISSFLRGLNQYKAKGNELQYFQAAWTGDWHVTTRKKDKEITKTVPYHNILGTTQLSEIKNLLITGIEPTDGVMERWLYSMSDYVQDIEDSDEEIPEELVSHIKKLFITVYEMEKADFSLDEEAREVFKKYYREIGLQMKSSDLPALLKSYLSKQRRYVARFALVLQCIKDHKVTIVNKDTMQDAIKLSRYFIECFKKLSKKTLDLKNNSNENYVIEYMRTNGLKEIAPSRLYLANKSRFSSTKRALEVLVHLSTQNYGYIVDVSNGQKFILY